MHALDDSFGQVCFLFLILIAFGRVDQILAAVGEQVFFAGRVVNAGHFARVYVEAVLAFLGEADVERHHVVLHVVRDELGETLLLDAVFVQRRHEVGQLARHPELDLELSTRKHKGVLKQFKNVLLKEN